MEILAWIQLGLSIIGGATVAFRMIAPLTENKRDDEILKVLEKVLSSIALNKDNSRIEIKI